MPPSRGLEGVSAASGIANPDRAGFGVYVHWPFCASRCPYCDFNSHVCAGGVDQGAFLEAYRREIRAMRALAGPREVGSIFFGGGTPSLMEPATVAGILDEIAAAWSIAPDAEITLEANPSSVEAGRFRDYASAGVNRVSLGVQSLIDEDLRALGRLHSAAEALAAIDAQTAVRTIAIEDVAPGPEQVSDGTYPFSLPLYLVAREEPTGAARAFLDFCLSAEGQRIVARRYVPVR